MPLAPGAQALGRTVMSVNLSAAQLADPQLVPDMQAVLARLGMPASALELEITESQLMDNAHAAQQQLAALKALGVHLSIDDFGTGYSSLAYLKRFDIDKPKIDKSFVRRTLPANPATWPSRAPSLRWAAAGPEAGGGGRGEWPRAGCDGPGVRRTVQGFHFSRPACAGVGVLGGWRQHRPDLRAPIGAGSRGAGQTLSLVRALQRAPARRLGRWPRPTGSCSRPASR